MFNFLRLKIRPSSISCISTKFGLKFYSLKIDKIYDNIFLFFVGFC